MNFEMPYMPHGHCYFWDPWIMWTHAISDGFIALAYTSIPVTLFYIYMKRKRDIRYVWMIILFAVFIFGCGLTHVMDVINIWEPFYYTDSAIRMVTAIASIGTAAVLIKISPDIVAIPSADKWIKVNMELNKQLQELKEKDEKIASIQHFQVLTETLPQLVVTVDEEGEASFYNEKWYNYTGQSFKKDFIFQINEVVHENQKQLLREQLQKTFDEGLHLDLQVCLRSYEGEYRWFMVKALPINSVEKGVLWVFTFTDIHDQNVRKVELEKKNDQLTRINNDLDTFIYAASHDLKHPIANIEGLFEALYKPSVVENPEMSEKIKGMIGVSIEKLKQTITDLADIAKIQKNIDEAPEVIKIKVVIMEVMEDLMFQINEAEAEINLDLNFNEMTFSKKNIRSVIYNLISNAIKYHHPERKPVIDIKGYEDVDNYILEFRDNGLGIDSKFIDKLFILFKRLHTHVDGTGIGLYIVKRIVENMGGSIEVDSVLHKGTVFRISIPKNNSTITFLN
jgi:PAS domain S-box-containing protein